VLCSYSKRGGVNARPGEIIPSDKFLIKLGSTEFMSEKITISKNLFTVICAALAVLAVIVLVMLVKPTESLPMTDLKKSLEQGNFPVLALVNKNAEVAILDSNGLPIKPCGNIKEIQVSGCNLKDVEIENDNVIRAFVVKGSPEQLCISDSSKKDIRCASVIAESQPNSKAARRCFPRADGSLVCP
jgi:hypothetical protein